MWEETNKPLIKKDLWNSYRSKPITYNFLNITVPARDPGLREGQTFGRCCWECRRCSSTLTQSTSWQLPEHHHQRLLQPHFPEWMFELPVSLVSKCFAALPDDPATELVGTDMTSTTTTTTTPSCLARPTHQSHKMSSQWRCSTYVSRHVTGPQLQAAC